MNEQDPPLVPTERAVLGAALTSQDSTETAVRIIGQDPDLFTAPAHRSIYAAVLRVREREQPVDATSISADLDLSGQFDEAGGADYLQQLVQAADHSAIEHNARRVAFVAEPLTADRVNWIAESLPGYLDCLEDPRKAPRPSVQTGFEDLDDLLTGLEPGTLTVISGRPRVGKSTLLGNFACSAALEQAIPTLWVDQENPHHRVIDRVISARARVPLNAIRARLMDDEAWIRTARFLGRLSETPLALHAGARTETDQIRRMAQESRAGLVAVDGLQLLKSFPDRETREREVSDITRELKDLALELEVPVVATAHLNRVPLQRPDPRPTLDDLRESDLIAHLADSVILIDRPGLHDPESPRVGEADLILAKHRNGPVCDVTVAFQGHYSRFVDMAPG